MAQLIAERLTGVQTDGYKNAAMQWGIDTEARARAAYEIATGLDVVECGLYAHPNINGTHASPDGLVRADGLVELKCPQVATHIETLLSGTMDERYTTQALWQMACTGRSWVDLVSFDPRLPDDLQIWIKRIERDDARIAELEQMVADFIGELETKLAKLETLIGK